MYVLLTYDVSDKQSDVKKSLLEKDYVASFPTGGKTVYLPDTTVCKLNSSDFKAALKDIQSIAAEHKVTLRRAIAVTYEDNNWQAIYGEPHK